MREYDPAIVIMIYLLNQPHTYEMGSPNFAAMSSLKFMSTTRDSFHSMASTEKTKVEIVLGYSCQF